MVDDSAPLNGVEDLCCVKAQTGSVAVVCNGTPLVLLTKGVCRIVDHPHSVFVRNALDLLHRADVAVDMNGEDCRGAVGNQRLELSNIHRVVICVDVAKDRCQIIAHDGMRRRGERERRRNDLAREIHRL